VAVAVENKVEMVRPVLLVGVVEAMLVEALVRLVRVLLGAPVTALLGLVVAVALTQQVRRLLRA
jgi:hypothetical protein